MKKFVQYTDNLQEIKRLEWERNTKKKLKDKQKINQDINGITMANSDLLKALFKSTNVSTDRLRFDVMKYTIESYKRLEDLNTKLEKAEKKS